MYMYIITNLFLSNFMNIVICLFVTGWILTLDAWVSDNCELILLRILRRREIRSHISLSQMLNTRPNDVESGNFER
jgi:hypothetical protein